MPERILDLTSGVTMVVSDLHGDKDAFARYASRFLRLRATKKVDRLLLLGDIVHSEGPAEQDESLSILLDIMRMQRVLPPQSVIMLLGNHEMPHIYGVTLAKGRLEYTPRFEHVLTESGKREEVIEYLESLPFYVRTASGVMFAHAGPHGSAAANIQAVRGFDHHQILEEFDKLLAANPHPEQLRALYGKTMGMPYDMLAKHYLAVSGQSDPRYDQLVRATMISQQSREFELLWDILFTRCELGMQMPLYRRMLTTFLDAFSIGAPTTQKFLVTGHIPVNGGHVVVTDNHLRIASAAHARPREAGKFLLLDFAKPVDNMQALEGMLDTVF
ncbi:MAG: metallophosphoesterase [Anaerolineae bacterium]|nr:metallophosphoesterase [Anaerolineae bacterium]